MHDNPSIFYLLRFYGMTTSGFAPGEKSDSDFLPPAVTRLAMAEGKQK
jgi:hypothetical protein